jgi:two-component system sensor histidine kinase/response regulator
MPRPKILVVDDQPINVQLLKRRMDKEGIETLSAHSGQEALTVVGRHRPDLILLDVMMPDMDGLEVCRRLQSEESSRHIPVIFVTASNTKESRLQGLAAGAVDYITKPVDLDETVARVRTQLRLVAINREILDLQRRLSEARRAAAIGAVTQGVAHNLNNLLGVALGYLDLIQSHPDKPEHVSKNAKSVEDAMQRIVSIIRQLGTLVTKSRPQLARCQLDEIIASAALRCQTEQKITAPIQIDNPLGSQPIDTHMEILEDALAKVLINAWEAYDSRPPAERTIWLHTRLQDRPEGKFFEISIEDAGHGINEQIRDRMFEPFVSTKQTVGVGMGLTVARHALRNLGGEITMSNRPGGGTIATILHPIERQTRRGT